MQEDFELGQFIRERVIPRAVLLYTGEGIEDDDVRLAHWNMILACISPN